MYLLTIPVLMYQLWIFLTIRYSPSWLRPLTVLFWLGWTLFFTWGLLSLIQFFTICGSCLYVIVKWSNDRDKAAIERERVAKAREEVAVTTRMKMLVTIGVNGHKIKPRANLRDADLQSTNLSFADLSSANLTGAKLNNVDLTGARLNNADLTGVDLTNADLTDAILWGVNLTNANLTNTTLFGTSLFGANLTNANLTGTKITNTEFTSATMPDGTIHE
jgi:hypothetical protein